MQGTTIYGGPNFKYRWPVTAGEYADMLAKFSGQEVSVGTNRDNPPQGSLGKWFTEKYGQYAMTSYVGPILIAEGYAVRGSQSDRIRFR